MPGHPPLAAWIPSGLPFLAQPLTVLGGQLQGCRAGLSHGEECVGDVGQKAVEIQKLPPAGLLLWARQQDGHHAGEELLAPSLRRLPPPFHLRRQSCQQPQVGSTALLLPTAPCLGDEVVSHPGGLSADSPSSPLSGGPSLLPERLGSPHWPPTTPPRREAGVAC